MPEAVPADRAGTASLPPGFVRTLRSRVAGEVRDDALTRMLYATDASSYQILPGAVVSVREPEDLAAAVATAAEFGVPVTPRGAGTGVAGGAVGAGLQIDTFHLERIEVDPRGRTATVTCGAVQRHVDAAAARHGLTFGPDTATADRATIGGMVANNSAGSRSIVYGQTRHRLAWAEVVLADGSVARFGPTRGGDLATGIQGLPAVRVATLASALAAIRTRAAPLVAERFPALLRHVDGYALDELCGDRPNLARVLCGSEGTLGVFVRLGLELDDRPRARALAVLAYPTLEAALEAAPGLLDLGPSAVEVAERRVLEGGGGSGAQLLPPGADAALMVEFQGATGEPEARVAALGRHGAAEVTRLTEPGAQRRAWRAREAALGSAMAIGQPGSLPSFVEDTAVDPDRMGAYVREFRRIARAHGADTVLWGHASVGCLHIRPFVDVRTAAGVADMEAMAREIVDLVRDFHGAVSGEHGDGIARSQWLERYLGTDLVAEFAALKRAFDPAGTMNPGKIVDPLPMTSNLRHGPGYRARRVATVLDFSADGGYAAAVERCFGAGACRKTDAGTMCPPAMVTRDERHSTRARANALRAVLDGRLPLSALAGAEAREVMGTCLACKACASECPVGVDMARLKADWRWRTHRLTRVPVRERAIAHLRLLSRMALPVAPLANAALRSAPGRAALGAAGIAADRRLPRLSRRRFSRSVASDRDPEVLVAADCFTEFQEPRVGTAAVALLRAAGLRSGPVDAGCCGRTMISEGFLDEARLAARSTAAALLPRVRHGQRVVFLEPSCQSAVVDDWRSLLPGEPAAAEVAAAVTSLEDALLARREALAFRHGAGGRVLLHGHCHQRALWGVEATVSALRLVPGTEVSVPDDGCCGMAGAFGYEAEHAELSRAIAERALLPAVRASGGAALVAPGTSCRQQVLDLAGRRPLHPAEYLALRLERR